MIDAALGRTGKPGRIDTATRMAMDSDFSDLSDLSERGRQKCDRRADDVDPLEELQRLTRGRK
jgi:hypothetical protein